MVNKTSPWRCEKYSRLERRRRKLGVHSPNQLRITIFYPILNKIEMILQTNREVITSLLARCEELSLKLSENQMESKLSYLFRILMKTVLLNLERSKHGYRFDEEIKMFSRYFFLVGGRMVYEFMAVNLAPALPCISTVEKDIKHAAPPVIEGEFRFLELKQYLEQRNYPLKVVIEEDGTRNISRFEYDQVTNEIIGPVLPLDSKTGAPICGSFPAKSAAMIAFHFQKGVPASNVYAIMAQPLEDKAPAFCLAAFGTDNRFTSEDVLKRWKFIHQELYKIGVEVVSFASDGDPKLLRAMQKHMFAEGKPFKEEWKDWFFARNLTGTPTVVQDTIHAANKFRSRLCPSYILPIGNYIASRAHLEILVQSVGKEDHGLTCTDIDNSDKMNFDSSVKISSERVTDNLMNSVPGSEATQEYLKVMRFTIESQLDKSLSISEKIFKIWYVVFFFRFLKVWILNHPSYTLGRNFVSSNLYVCIEILAHSLLVHVVKFRKSPQLLLTHLFSSQGCESFFRMARSLTTTLSTIINFSVKQFLYKIRKIHMLLDVSCKLEGKLEFPRDKRKRLIGLLTKEQLERDYMPSDQEISAIVMNAQSEVKKNLEKLGVKCSSNLSLARRHLVHDPVEEQDVETDHTEDPRSYRVDFPEDDDLEDDVPIGLLAAFPSADDVEAIEPSEDVENHPSVLPENSIFVSVPNKAKQHTPIRKSTLCWLLASEGLRISSDRLHRVREKVLFSFGKVMMCSDSGLNCHQPELKVGQWCVFKKKSAYCIGQSLGFAYLTGASRSYTLSTVPTRPPPKPSKARGIGCLCAWYSKDKNGCLTALKTNEHRYYDMKYYVGTLSPPVIENNSLVLPEVAIRYASSL